MLFRMVLPEAAESGGCRWEASELMIPLSKEFAGPHSIATRALEKRFGRTRALAGGDLSVLRGGEGDSRARSG